MGNEDVNKIVGNLILDVARSYDYYHYGLRVVDDLPEDGEILEPSRVWIDNEPTSEILDGTSCVGLSATNHRFPKGVDIDKAIRRLGKVYGPSRRIQPTFGGG